MTVPLFSPFALREVVLRNRIVVSPMCQYSAPTGIPLDWHLVHLGARAVGGAALVFTEATAVTPAGRITPFDLGLWNDDQEAAFSRIASFVAEQGAVPGIQLAHAGRKASHTRPWERRKPLSPAEGGWTPVGPSPLSWAPDDPVPTELRVEDIAGVIEAYRQGARRAERAGFRVLELHAAHGYLLHSFLSPLSNIRTDSYGGSRENRSRLLLDCVRAVREEWPVELPLFVRLSATDWIDGGWTIEDTIWLACLLREAGVDVIDCSSGGSAPEQRIVAAPHFQVPFATRVKAEAGVATMAVGMITSPVEANQIVSTGKADLVALGRAALWNPYWPLHAARALGLNPDLPLPYARAHHGAPDDAGAEK